MRSRKARMNSESVIIGNLKIVEARRLVLINPWSQHLHVVGVSLLEIRQIRLPFEVNLLGLIAGSRPLFFAELRWTQDIQLLHGFGENVVQEDAERTGETRVAVFVQRKEVV